MRQGQQNRRGRGRHNGGGGGHGGNYSNNNNNNRKGQNPLARSYESNGPDVKIRGNPAHIAEKYMTLARDAQSSGDSVLAESYLQHAEHYNRIIMAFREQQQQNPEGQFRQRPQGEGPEGAIEGGIDDDADDGVGGVDGPIRGQEPQPGIFDMSPPRYADRQGEQPQRDDRGNRDDRGPRGYDDRQMRRQDGNRDGGRRDRYGDGPRFGGNRDDRRERYDRYQGQERGQDRSQDRSQDRGQDRGQERGQSERYGAERPAQDRVTSERAQPERIAADLPRALPETAVVVPMEPEVAAPIDREPREPREAPAPRRRAAAPAERFADGQPEQAPEFLRRPVRRPRREASTAAAADAPEGTPATDESTGKSRE